ncbi:MAG: helix-turn-helix transcriptional regulator [Sphingomonadaceae bacterium]|nr:helix-turn-helix transcriptional regulator [Sphingomonadaceae bacterium]
MSPAIIFRYIAPDPDLAPLVAFYYTIEVGDTAIAEPVCALLGQVQVCLAGRAGYSINNGLRVLPDVAVVAPTDRAARFCATPGYRAVGCGLTPSGWAALVAAPANGIASGSCDGTALLGPAAAALGAVAAADVPLAAFAAAVAGLAAVARPVDPRIAPIDRWIIAGAPGDAQGLAATFGCSRRSLERLTAATHGATPKLIAAKYRALMAAAWLAFGESGSTGEVAGFADQSHYIREFRRFVGVTPGVFAAYPDSLVAQLVRGQRQPGRLPGIAIWHG